MNWSYWLHDALGAVVAPGTLAPYRKWPHRLFDKLSFARLARLPKMDDADKYSLNLELFDTILSGKKFVDVTLRVEGHEASRSGLGRQDDEAKRRLFVKREAERSGHPQAHL